MNKIKNSSNYRNRIAFAQAKLKTSKVYLVYDMTTDIDSLVKNSYTLGTEDTIKEVGFESRNIIKSSFANSGELVWPIEPNYLLEKHVPHHIMRLLSLIIHGKEFDSLSNDVKKIRIIESIGQDLCRAATNNQWKLPKHIGRFEFFYS